MFGESIEANWRPKGYTEREKNRHSEELCRSCILKLIRVINELKE